MKDEGNAFVSQLLQMFERKMGGEIVVENDIRNTGRFFVAGDGHERQSASLVAYRVHRDDSFNGSLLQEEWIFLNEVAAVLVAHDKVKIAFLEKMILDPRHHQRRVALPDLGNKDTNGIALPERIGILGRR